ncbi:hypothetical protein KC19_12G070900 [Ceratodon purpureus]|uniref:Uncharacterized protein n=1 Tax=Ceratodon purpureus TaxID=3225 RepID=A0A8T0G839_CERPU|nr:hypothetical protein KC19_12G070900 [Ceratodon purpureus]
MEWGAILELVRHPHIMVQRLQRKLHQIHSLACFGLSKRTLRPYLQFLVFSIVKWKMANGRWDAERKSHFSNCSSDCKHMSNLL